MIVRSKKISFIENKRLPHEVSSLMLALHHAASGLLDSRLQLLEKEEMYAVFEEISLSCAFAMLYVGFSNVAMPCELTSEEGARKIYVHLTGKRRTAGRQLSCADLVFGEEISKNALENLLRHNRMAYKLTERDGDLLLSVSIPRFLSTAYDVGAVDKDSMCDRFYDAMLRFSGEEPKAPLPLQK